MTRAALYRHYDKSERLLYVGVTRDPARRFAVHCVSKDWAHDVVTIRLEWFQSKTDAFDAERVAIASERPVYNFQHNGLKPTRFAAPARPVKHPELLKTIEDYCAARGMAKTVFGAASVGDLSLVKNISDGRECRRKTVARVLQYIETGGAA